MDVTKILAELKSERVQIEEAIVSLERLARGRGRRRGRPPLDGGSNRPQAPGPPAGEQEQSHGRQRPVVKRTQ